GSGRSSTSTASRKPVGGSETGRSSGATDSGATDSADVRSADGRSGDADPEGESDNAGSGDADPDRVGSDGVRPGVRSDDSMVGSDDTMLATTGSAKPDDAVSADVPVAASTGESTAV